MVSPTSWLLHARAVGTIDPGLTVVVVAGGALAGLAIARAAIGRGTSRPWLRTFVALVVATVGVRVGLAFAGLQTGSFHSLEHVLDAAMIALTVATLYVARARRRELGAAGSAASR